MKASISTTSFPHLLWQKLYLYGSFILYYCASKIFQILIFQPQSEHEEESEMDGWM